MFNHSRFLIVRLSSIGDVLHATTVAHNLKQAYPQCHITWIVSRTAAELLHDNPDIDTLFVWSREDFEKALQARQFATAWSCISQLRDFFAGQHFDIALDVHGLFMTGVITRLSQAPRRIGMAGTRELNRFFMTELAPPVASPHMIRRYLSVLTALGIKSDDYQLFLKLPAELCDFPAKFDLAHGIDRKRKLLMVTPWTSWQSKNWGIENFAACLNQLPSDIQILLCGGPSDRENNAAIRQSVSRPLTDITGQTSLLELAALIAKADLLLTGDTGALHMATALKVPTLSLWGPTRPEKYGPLVPGHVFLCATGECTNCNKTKCRQKNNACMNSLLAQQVADKTMELLRKNKEKASR